MILHYTMMLKAQATGASGESSAGARALEIASSGEPQAGGPGDLLDSVSEGVSVVAKEGTIRYANRAMKELLGLHHGEHDSIFEAFARLMPEPAGAARAVLQWTEHVQRGGVAEHTIEIVRDDGAQRWVSLGLSPLGDGWVIVRAVDITCVREEREARGQLEEQLFQAQKMGTVGTLVGGMARDVNDVLDTIMDLASMLQRSDVGDTTRVACVNGILAAAQRGRDLTDNLLGFARKGSCRKTRVRLNELVHEVRELLAGSVPGSIRIVLSLAPDLVEVEADASLISQALMNLCMNSVEAMGELGTVTISTSNLSLPGDSMEQWVYARPGRHARISVEDDGPGMDPQTLARAFEPLFTTKPEGRGTGLGLSMVLDTARRHGGDVHLWSRPGAGTMVTMLLPELAGDQMSEEPQVVRPGETTSEPVAPGEGGWQQGRFEPDDGGEACDPRRGGR